jgi:dinuclear metal center YbgI/SA1388 family protein
MTDRRGDTVSGGVVQRSELMRWLHMELNCAAFKDYCPNGLQVEGKAQIRRVVSAVTASRAAIQAAIDLKADALLVHHGLFWRNDDPCVVGMLRARLAPALAAGLNVFAYHLPLDAHPVWGNNVQLLHALGLAEQCVAPPKPLEDEPLVWLAQLRQSIPAQQLADQVAAKLGRAPLLVATDAAAAITHFAWCTGGAQGYLKAAAQAGAQAYLSGEISEQTTHEARELGLAYIAAGHHATEQFGVQALGEALVQQFGIEHLYFSDLNPA